MSELISVMVPTYNVGRFLPSFFSAMQNQTFKNFALYFIYDKSSDDTLDKLFSLIKQYPNLTSKILFSPEKKGLGAARDFGLDSGQLNGKYLISLDPDDFAHPDFFEKLIAKAEASGGADIVFCGFRRVDFESKKVIAIDMTHNPSEILISPATCFPLIFCNPSTWNKLIKMEKIKDCRYVLPGGSGEDVIFYCKLIPYCSKAAFVNEVLIDYSIRKDSFAAGTNTKSFEVAKNGFLSVKSFFATHHETHKQYEAFLDAVVFLRAGIGMTTRVCISEKNNKKKTIRETTSFLDSNFPNWRKNRYLSFSSCAKGGRKTILVHFVRTLYKAHLFGLFVSFYHFFTSVFHKDVKY